MKEKYLTGEEQQVFTATLARHADAATGLLNRGVKAMLYEPIALYRDDDGNMHFAEGKLPYKTIIDVLSLPFGSWMKKGRNSLEIYLDGREVIYDKVAITPEGFWICHLRFPPVEGA